MLLFLTEYEKIIVRRRQIIFLAIQIFELQPKVAVLQESVEVQPLKSISRTPILNDVPCSPSTPHLVLRKVQRQRFCSLLDTPMWDNFHPHGMRLRIHTCLWLHKRARICIVSAGSDSHNLLATREYDQLHILPFNHHMRHHAEPLNSPKKSTNSQTEYEKQTCILSVFTSLYFCTVCLFRSYHSSKNDTPCRTTEG